MIKNQSGKLSFLTRYIVIGIILFILDQITKVLVVRNLTLGESIPLYFIDITRIHNTGISFGSFQLIPRFVLIIAALLVLFILFMMRKQLLTNKMSYLAYSLVLAGAFGNLVDRIVYGHVIDFLNLGWWPAFNIADTCICIGAGLLFYAHTFAEDLNKSRRLNSSR